MKKGSIFRPVYASSDYLPERLEPDSYVTIPAREGGTGDFWFVTLCMVPLILYLTGTALVELDMLLTPFLLIMAAVLTWVYLALLGSTLRFAYRRSRGWPGLHIDQHGLYGSVINVRGGRVSWADILAVDHQTSAHSIFSGIALAVPDRVPGRKGLRFRREVDLLMEMLPVEAGVLLPLLQAAHRQWAPTEDSPVLLDGRPVTLLNSGMALQDARLAAIGRGEKVSIDYRKGRIGLQLLVLLPLLLMLLAAMVAISVGSWMIDDFRDDLWAVVLINLLGLVISPLLGYAIYNLIDRYRNARSGKPLYVLDAQGLHDPARSALRRPLPWSACTFAYLRRHHRAPDTVMLPAKNLDAYTRDDRTADSVGRILRKRFVGDSLNIEYGLAGLRPDEMCDLLNAAIIQWGSD